MHRVKREITGELAGAARGEHIKSLCSLLSYSRSLFSLPLVSEVAPLAF